MTLYTQQSRNIRKTWLLMTVFFVVIMAIGWVFAQVYGNPGFLYFAVIFSVGMNFFSYWYSDKIVLKMAGAVLADHESNRELYHVVENLAITAGLPTPKIYIINDSAPNAFATGRNKEHAVVAVTTGLLARLERSELEGVIAHELSHIGNKDILISTIVVVLVGFISILSNMFMRSRFGFFGGFGRSRSSDDKDGAGVVMLVIGIILSILAPIAATLIQLAISRKREFLADASGALLTRYPEGLASALKKISAYSAPMQHANSATAHMYISNPFGPFKGRVNSAGKRLSGLFATHPPVEERVRALMGMKTG